MSTETDWGSLAASYEAGRPSPDSGFESWRLHLMPLVSSGDRVVDVGAGTGQWGRALARWFTAVVVAVEPSMDMIRAGSSGRVTFVQGRGERLPSRSGRFDRVWLSTVLGQLEMESAVREMSRVLIDDRGVVLIREGGSPTGRGTHLFSPTFRRSSTWRRNVE